MCEFFYTFEFSHNENCAIIVLEKQQNEKYKLVTELEKYD